MSVYSDNIADKYEEHQTVQGRVDIWLNASELFCLLKQYQDAVNCLQEARAIVNISADIFYLVRIFYEL